MSGKPLFPIVTINLVGYFIVQRNTVYWSGISIFRWRLFLWGKTWAWRRERDAHWYHCLLKKAWGGYMFNYFWRNKKLKYSKSKWNIRGVHRTAIGATFLRKFLNGLFFKTSSPTFKMIMTRLTSFQNQCSKKGYILILFTNWKQWSPLRKQLLFVQLQ